MYMDKEGTTLATEIFLELKASAKRWFIAFLVMVAVEIATVAGFLWYISLPVDETTVTQELDDGDNNNLIGIGDNYGGTADSSQKTAGSEETETLGK